MKREREEELCNQKRDVSMAEKHRETEVTQKTVPGLSPDSWERKLEMT
jgi:hypothetical protein